MAISASDARKNLFSLIEQVNNDCTPIEITSRHGSAVLISRADYDALEETAHLLGSPANAGRLLESLAQVRGGEWEGVYPRAECLGGRGLAPARPPVDA